jgi:Obg family GTPase CgtA-like protein
MPAAVAISAAATFERMPPEPIGDVAVLIDSDASCDGSSTDGTWIVYGESVERLIARWDLDNEEAQAHVERRLARMGVIAALERAGFEPGDDVEIGGTVFELDPS